MGMSIPRFCYTSSGQIAVFDQAVPGLTTNTRFQINDQQLTYSYNAISAPGSCLETAFIASTTH
jgi:hypothetical protein